MVGVVMGAAIAVLPAPTFDVPSMNETPPASVCAVVVAYHPDEGLEDRLRILLPQVDALVVVDNTPPAERRRQINLSSPNVQTCLIENADNLGVGAALNQGLEQATQWNCNWLLTLDQDSRCHADMVQILLSVVAHCSQPPAVVGSNYLDPRNGRSKVPVAGNTEFIDQKTVITSGTLVDVQFALSIGGFRTDYFIDQLDHEFCLRVRAQGGRVVISRRPVMMHSVGESGGAWLPLFGHLPNHPPLRKYYVARNSVMTIATYWRSEPDWCLRRGLRLLGGLLLMATLERLRLKKMLAFALGVADALAGRSGPCRRAWLRSGG